MSDTTRPHPRVDKHEPPGRRAQLSVGTLYLPPNFVSGRGRVLIVHFHGAHWLIEHHVLTQVPQAALVSLHLGGGSRVYADAFLEPGRLETLVDEASGQAGRLLGASVFFDRIVLSSFSAGYGAVRSILQQPQQYARVDAVLLADSLHAGYAVEAAGARAADLPVDEGSLAPFVSFARDAAEGRKRLLVTHSEVFPGTYASTTETADVLLRAVGIRRVRVLREGPIGMQNLSDTRHGRFHLLGFAGNSAPDHMDHLYALGVYLPPLVSHLP